MPGTILVGWILRSSIMSSQVWRSSLLESTAVGGFVSSSQGCDLETNAYRFASPEATKSMNSAALRNLKFVVGFRNIIDYAPDEETSGSSVIVHSIARISSAPLFTTGKVVLASMSPWPMVPSLKIPASTTAPVDSPSNHAAL